MFTNATPFDRTRLRARREALRMTREELGAFLCVSPKTIEKWELGSTKPADAALGYLRVFLSDPAAVGRALGTLDLLRGRTVDFDMGLEPAVVLSPDPVLPNVGDEPKKGPVVGPAASTCFWENLGSLKVSPSQVKSKTVAAVNNMFEARRLKMA